MLEALNFAETAPTVVFIALFLGTFISEDAACLIAGSAVAAGETSFALAVSACLAGIFVGDLMLYGTGRIFGTAVFRTRLIRRLVSDDSRERAHLWLSKNVGVAVVTSRFISGLRLPMYLAAGAVRADARKFTAWFLLAAAVWTPLLVGAATLSVSLISPGSLSVGFVATAISIQLIRTFSSWTRRRLLVAKLKRITNWEFWPLAIFYMPVAFYTVWLAIRHRSATVFTAANPSIPASGFVGESKDQIYSLIRYSRGADRFLLQHIKIDSTQPVHLRFHTAVEFIVKHSITFPVVVKPNVGERGKGVWILRDLGELLDSIRSADRDLILQEFCDGVEASVFHYRFPHEKRGRIFSITEKRFPFVTGDGRSTVRDLILRDERAVCMAGSYFAEQRHRLGEIPKDGERIKLIDIGTHSRGAIFLDGEHLQTAGLETAIDEISRGIDGFYFGRYDVKAKSFNAVMAGDFKIIELNGVTSESTNIYDPKFSLIDAYRILFRQWRLAFEIGTANARRGFKAVSFCSFVRLVIDRDASVLAAPCGSDKLQTATYLRSCA